ncbi:hypothetical protein G9A89_010541 [Geosiphon pyriformis]|nr:hypothetical protein G9A89_010541 [Geosiphon pyriformis]
MLINKTPYVVGLIKERLPLRLLPKKPELTSQNAAPIGTSKSQMVSEVVVAYLPFAFNLQNISLKAAKLVVLFGNESSDMNFPRIFLPTLSSPARSKKCKTKISTIIAHNKRDAGEKLLTSRC